MPGYSDSQWWKTELRGFVLIGLFLDVMCENLSTDVMSLQAVLLQLGLAAAAGTPVTVFVRP